jgi:hypothetical protein
MSSLHALKPPLGPNKPPVQWVLGPYPGSKVTGAWRWPATHHCSVPRLKKEYWYSYTSLCTYTGMLRGTFAFSSAALRDAIRRLYLPRCSLISKHHTASRCKRERNFILSNSIYSTLLETTLTSTLILYSHVRTCLPTYL